MGMRILLKGKNIFLSSGISLKYEYEMPGEVEAKEFINDASFHS